MKHMLTVMRVTRKDFLEECLPVGKPGNKVVKHSPWMFRALPQSRFDRGKHIVVGTDGTGVSVSVRLRR